LLVRRLGCWGGGMRMDLGRTVLVVADDRSLMRGLADGLEEKGYAAVMARSGVAAMRIVTGLWLDAAVIEYRLPGWRGDALMESIVVHQPHLRGRTVFMTAGLAAGGATITTSLGCPVFEKPFEVDALYWQLRVLLRAPARE
jgi:DNA-binding NtrC family response regulator